MKALLSIMNARLRDDSPVYGNVKWPAACTQDQKEERTLWRRGRELGVRLSDMCRA